MRAARKFSKRYNEIDGWQRTIMLANLADAKATLVLIRDELNVRNINE